MTTTASMIDFAPATAALNAANSILLVTHIFPDGDAIGSLLGLGNALRERGLPVKTMVVDGGVPVHLGFLPGTERVKSEIVGDTDTFDLMVSLDASDEERTGAAGIYGRAHSKTVINVDHHPTNTRFGDIHLIQPDAVSTTQIVFDWLAYLNQPITRTVAVPLLTGLVTDTLGFRTSNVRPATLGYAQKLMEAGASLTEITARTLGSMPYDVIELWKYALQSVQLDNGVISANATLEDGRRAGQKELSTGSLVEFLVRAEEAMISVVFKERENNQVELGFRCKPGFDVASVAFGLGGGGHKQASGATIDGTIDEARARVLPLLQQARAAGKLTIV